MDMTTIRVATFNASNLKGKVEEIIEYMEECEIDLTFVCETWLRPLQDRPHECVQYRTSYQPLTTTKPIYGVAVIVNPKHTTGKGTCDSLAVHGGSPGLTVFFTFKGISFGGVYLPCTWPDEKVMDLMAFPSGAGPVRVLLGDFNMRLGTRTGDHKTNQRGGTLFPVLEESGWNLCKADDDCPTFSNPRGSSIVDYFMTNGSSRDLWIRTYTAQDFCGSSDHCMVISEFTAPVGQVSVPMAETVQYSRWNYKRLEDEIYRELYKATLQEHLGACDELHERLVAENRDEKLTDQELVDQLNEAITSALTRTAEATIGEVKVRIKKGRMVDNTLQRIKQHKNTMQRKARRADKYDHFLAEELWKQYKELRDLEARYLRNSVRKAYERFSKELHSKSRTEAAKILRSIKSRGQGDQGRSCLCSDAESMEKYRGYFEDQFTRKEWQGPPVEVDLTTTPTDPDQEPFPTVVIERAIADCPNGKAAGQSGIRMELLKPCKSAAAQTLKRLFEECWKRGVCPQQWCIALLHPILKKGDPTQIEHYRPISLTETIRKIFERCLLWTKLDDIARSIDICQGGFRAGRSAIDQVAALHEAIIQKRDTLKRPALLCFLDIKSAYDTVDREKLWVKMIQKGASKELVQILMALFSKNESRVVVKGHRSNALKLTMGLLQGSIVSPVLYSIFIDDLAGEVRKEGRGKLGGTTIGAFLYADDIALVADDEEHMQRILSVCEQHSYRNGYRFAPQKCELITPRPELDCQLYGQKLRTVETFVYLGIVLDIKGICVRRHVKRNAAKFMNTVHFYRQIGLTGMGLTNQVKIMLITTFMRPILEYGLAILSLNLGLSYKIQVPMNTALRYAFSALPRTKNDMLYVLSDIPTMRHRHQALQAKWMVHVVHAQDDMMVKEAYREYNLSGLKDSVFGGAHVENQMIRAMKRVGLLQNATAADCSQGLKEVIEHYRDLERRQMRRSQQTIDQVLADDCPTPTILRYIDDTFSRRSSQLILLWLLRNPFGLPTACAKCLKETVTIQHVQECTGLPIDYTLRKWDFSTALRYICRALYECCGRTSPRVVNYEKKPQALLRKQRTRPSLMSRDRAKQG